MNPADDIWAKVIELMKQQGLSPTTIKTWFDDAKAVSLTEDSFTISTPNDYTQSVIKSLYIPKIEAALKELFSMDLKVVVLTEKELENTSAAKQDILFPGTSDYTFERFVVGSSNRYAYSAARAVADYLALELTRMFLFLVSFALVLLLWLLLSRVLDLACKLPVLSTLNHWSGAALGLVKGGLIVFILCWLLRGSLISQEAVEGTVLLRFFCTHTPLSLLAPLLFR